MKGVTEFAAVVLGFLFGSLFLITSSLRSRFPLDLFTVITVILTIAFAVWAFVVIATELAKNKKVKV